MISELKEKIIHGTKEYPYEQYNIQNSERTFHVPVHWHDEMEIIVIERGELEIKIGENDYLGHAGDIYFVNPRELHLMGPSEVDGLYHTLLFPLEFISFQTIDTLERELLSPIRSNNLLFPTTPSTELSEQIRPFIYEIITANLEKNTTESDKISLTKHHLNTRIQLLQIIKCIYEDGSFVKPTTTTNSNTPREMIAFIQENYLENISLEILANRFHMSEKYISRYFSNHFKLSFSNYVLHLRLSYARQLLETTDESITEIAMMSGFSNVSYFIRAFKKIYGQAPLQYKKALYFNS